MPAKAKKQNPPFPERPAANFSLPEEDKMAAH
jgi:hypothetical protein